MRSTSRVGPAFGRTFRLAGDGLAEEKKKEGGRERGEKREKGRKRKGKKRSGIRCERARRARGEDRGRIHDKLLASEWPLVKQPSDALLPSADSIPWDPAC